MSAVETVLEWHAALNAGDVERMVALSTDDVEVGGPRGSGHGAQLLREWFGRANVVLEPGNTYARGDVVAVEQVGRWRLEDGSLGEAQPVASVFRVTGDGRVNSVLRYPDGPSALAAAGLSASDLTL